MEQLEGKLEVVQQAPTRQSSPHEELLPFGSELGCKVELTSRASTLGKRLLLLFTGRCGARSATLFQMLAHKPLLFVMG